MAKPTGQFVYLMRLGTGLSGRTLLTWSTLEDGPTDNPLNIGPGNRYGSVAKGAAATIALLRGPSAHAYGYDVILSSAAKGDKEQLKAIAISDWNGGPLAPESVHIEYGARLEKKYNDLFPSGKIHFGPGDIHIDNPVTGAKKLAKDIAPDLLGKIASTSTWIRALLVIVGTVALIGALGIFVRELR